MRLPGAGAPIAEVTADEAAEPADDAVDMALLIVLSASFVVDEHPTSASAAVAATPTAANTDLWAGIRLSFSR
jgi:hypothetical protein